MGLQVRVETPLINAPNAYTGET